jgi:hypothetical protein
MHSELVAAADGKAFDIGGFGLNLKLIAQTPTTSFDRTSSSCTSFVSRR